MFNFVVAIGAFSLHFAYVIRRGTGFCTFMVFWLCVQLLAYVLCQLLFVSTCYASSVCVAARLFNYALPLCFELYVVVFVSAVFPDSLSVQTGSTGHQ